MKKYKWNCVAGKKMESKIHSTVIEEIKSFSTFEEGLMEIF
jgi:hypothetical protein